MKPEIRSVTVYVQEEQFEQFMQGKYKDIRWALTPEQSSLNGFFAHRQVCVQISIDTYYNMLDARKEDDAQSNPPF